MLKQELEKYSKDMASKAPKQVLEVMKKATKELIESKIDKKSLKKNIAPEFSLSNVDGKPVSSKELLKKGPLIVKFYRGSWCPYCNLEIAAWQKLYPQVKKLGAELIAISPNIPDKLSVTKNRHKVSFELLSDIKNKVARKFGLVFTLPKQLRPIYQQFGIDLPKENADESFELPIPATYIIKDNKIVYSYVNPDYTKRAEPKEVLDEIKKLK